MNFRAIHTIFGLVYAFIPITSAIAVNMSQIECLKLSREFTSETFLPNQTEYLKLKDQNWSGTAQESPSCIFQPANTDELAQIVKQLQKNSVQFAVRSGGHMPSPGAANINEGVLIDLANFNEVTYDAAQNAAIVGSGLRWGYVYEQLDKFNVTVVGGRVLNVGVGGLTLGSGLSYLSDMYGLVCDNVLNFEVVIGNGTIINANNTSNPDLFWALKGGGNNFGIVTRFTLVTYPNSEVWGGVKAYTLDQLPALFDAMYEYQTVETKDPKANLMLQGYVSNATVGIVLNMIYLAPEESPAAFAPFYGIKPTADSTKISSLTAFLQGQGPINFPPRIDWRATSFMPNKDLYGKLASLMINSAALAKIKGVQAGTVAFGLQPISTSAIEAGIARSGNALGLQTTNQTWYVIDSGWWQESDDHTVHSATETMVNSIRSEAEAAGVHLPYIFMNDASYDQYVIGGYGDQNVAKLQSISTKYDQNQVFQWLVPGGFKLTPFS